MNLSRTTLHVALMAALAYAAHATAQGDALQPRTQNNVTYVTGGVGEEQQQRMQALAQQGYTLQLVFAEKGTGAYVADVRVDVADSSGRTVLDAIADGPAFFARLPEGDYRVTMEYRGMRQTRTVHASPHAGQTVIYWSNEGGSAPLPASTRAPHAEGPALSPPHAGESAGPAR
ncbi:MAG TPA: carboxypeptidase regulatory-like domain-containing protein [Casimicrobiaceae bacterium]|nr:carboxypeptidase regulatory-like domain-containing protein [Casimicrobiaceae bacterium]